MLTSYSMKNDGRIESIHPVAQYQQETLHYKHVRHL